MAVLRWIHQRQSVSSLQNPEFEDVRSLEGVAPTKKPCVPIIAVPTTAGTAKRGYYKLRYHRCREKRKFVCVDPHDMPIIAIVDPDMMSSMPKGLTASTGMDALHMLSKDILQRRKMGNDRYVPSQSDRDYRKILKVLLPMKKRGVRAWLLESISQAWDFRM